MSNWKEETTEAAVRIKNTETVIKSYKEKIKKLQDEVKDLQCNVDEDKENIIAALEDNGVDKLVYDGVTVTMSDSPYSVVISDESKVPEQYKTEQVVINIDKKALIKDRDLVDVDGIEFVQTKKLTIKV